MSDGKPLFFSDDSEDEAEAKPVAAPIAKDEDASSDIVLLDTPPKAVKRKPSTKAAPVKPSKKLKLSSPDANEIPKDEDGEPLADWTMRYIGSMPAVGWLTTSSKFMKLQEGEKVTFVHDALKQDANKKSNTKEKLNILIYFKNARGFECGRIVRVILSLEASDAVYRSKSKLPSSPN
jgi:hypothetical protein